MDYGGRVVIVTGASSGIGRQLALDFAARGASLVISARRREMLEEVAAECRRSGGSVEALTGDVGERAFVESMAARAVERFGRIDVVVNNAGISKHKQIYHVTGEDVDAVLRVNFLAPAFLTLAALPAMLRRGEGWVVNISSAAGKLPPPRETVYAASKFALTGFTEGLWLDLAGSGIHATVIHVGAIDTEIWHKTDEPTAYRGRKLPPAAVVGGGLSRHRAATARGLGAGDPPARVVAATARPGRLSLGGGPLRSGSGAGDRRSARARRGGT